MTKEFITKEFLDTLPGGFYILTTKKEHFYIQKRSDQSYLFKDVIPPVLELDLSDYGSIKLVQSQVDRMKDGSSESAWANLPGIARGRFFGFQKMDENEFLLSNGKIDQCFYEVKFNEITLRFHALELPGKKISLEELEGSMTLVTDTDTYKFSYEDKGLKFENREVLRICSIFNTKNVPDLLSFSSHRVFETSDSYIYINRPFLIITKDVQEKIRFTYVTEPLKALRPA